MKRSNVKHKEEMERLHGLDFARATMMILGIFYHSALIWSPTIEWRTEVRRSSHIFDYIINFNTSFRMEIFFIIAGFFYLFIQEKRREKFIIDRLRRLIIPFISASVLLAPILYFYSPNVSFSKNSDFFVYGEWIGHLWFLANLILYYLIVYPITKFKDSFELKNEKIFLFAFIIITPLLSTALRKIGSFYDITFLIFKIKYLLYYFPYFCLGLLCYSNIQKFILNLNSKTIKLCFIILLLIGISKELFITSEAYLKFLSYIQRGSLSLLVLSFLFLIGNRKNKIMKYISDSSYTIYLLHMPVILVFHYYISSHIENLALAYTLLVTFTFLSTFIFHQFLVRKNKTLTLLFNGKPIKRNIEKIV